MIPRPAGEQPRRAETLGWRRRLRRRGSVRRVVVAAALIAAAALGGMTESILALRSSELADAGQTVATLDLLLSEQTARALDSVALVVNGVADQFQAEGIADGDQYARLKSGREIHDLLRRRTSGLPQLDAITLIAADGHLVNFSRYYPVPAVNVADRDYFRALRENPELQTYLSDPVVNRGTGTWTIYYARRVNGPSGEFVGLVLGAMDLGYFQRIFTRVHAEQDVGIGLWRRDGTLLAHEPPVEEVGRVATPLPDFLAAPAETVQLARRVAPEGSVLTATRSLASHPVVVEVSQPVSAALAGWRRLALVIGAAGIAFVAAVIVAAEMLVRRLAGLEALSDAVAAREDAVRARRTAEERLHQAQKMEAIGQLTGGIAHDFNNLLTAVLGNLELLQRQVAGNERAEGLVVAARRAGDRGAALTRSLLAFARRQTLRAETADANALIRDFGSLIRNAAGAAVDVMLDLDPGLLPCTTDPAQLQSAILNLVINARDAMPVGGTLTIATANTALGPADLAGNPEARPGPFVAIAVRDTGAGMTPDVLARAFEPFFTTKEVGRGSGLGLSQIFGFIRQSGGHVTLESAPGAGTCVTLFLPCAAEAPVPAVESPERVDRSVDATILLVEDDPDVLAVVQRSLREAGCRVITARDGAEALAVLESGVTIDLLFADIVMPGGLSGVELARRARALRPRMPVLLTSGYAASVLAAQGVRSDEFEILPKPYRHAELAARIRGAVLARQPAGG